MADTIIIWGTKVHLSNIGIMQMYQNTLHIFLEDGEILSNTYSHKFLMCQDFDAIINAVIQFNKYEPKIDQSPTHIRSVK